jgi:diguanylate cyclase (GGDEF)-like protein
MDQVMHRTLLRQLRRLGLHAEAPPTLDVWRELLQRVSATYVQADEERYTLERSTEISSSEMQQLHAMLARQARTDELTGLPNRAAIVDDLAAALSYAPGAPEVAVLFIDLDRFKLVNDHLGHAVGDELLVQVAARLRASIRQGDTVGRYGGDEFVAVLNGLTTGQGASAIADRIVATMGRPFHLSVEDPVSIGASVGIAFAQAGMDVAAVLREADSAMYEAKVGGRGRCVHGPALRESA